MGRSRSYPYLDLGEAIKLANTLFEERGKSATTADDIATVWGFKGVHGKSGRVLSALKQYGLLDKKNGLMSLTRRALTILTAPEGSEERAAAIVRAAKEPTMFSEIVEAYPDGLPSDEGLISRLVTNPEWDFNRGAAKRLVEVLRTTTDLVSATDRRYSGDGDGENTHDDDPSPEDERPKRPLRNREREPMPSTGAGTKRDWDLTIPLVEGGQAILRVPIPVTDEDFDMLKSVITGNLDAMRKAIVRAPGRPETDPEDDG